MNERSFRKLNGFTNSMVSENVDSQHNGMSKDEFEVAEACIAVWSNEVSSGKTHGAEKQMKAMQKLCIHEEDEKTHLLDESSVKEPYTSFSKTHFKPMSVSNKTSENSAKEKSSGRKRWAFMKQRVNSFAVHKSGIEATAAVAEGDNSVNDQIHDKSEKGDSRKEINPALVKSLKKVLKSVKQVKTKNKRKIVQRTDSTDIALDSANLQLWECAVAILAYLGIGVAAFSFIFEKWPVVDALYFSVVTFTTVGYGDFAPTTMPGKAFNSFFALGGVAFLGFALGEIANNLVASQVNAIEGAKRERTQSVASQVEWVDDVASPHLSSGNNSEKGSFVKDELSCGAISRQFQDCLPGMTWLCERKKTLMELCAILSILLISAFIMGWIEKWNFAEAVYFTIITASTVGYGDATPQSIWGRWYSIAYIPISVGVVGLVLSKVAQAVLEEKKNQALDKIMACRITVEDLERINSSKGDGGVTRSDYIEFMLVRMNIVERSFLNKLHGQFDALDMDGNGVLQKEDLIERAKEKNRDLRYKLRLASYKHSLMKKSSRPDQNRSNDSKPCLV